MRKKFLNDYFGFNKQQRRGLIVLCVLCFLLLVLRVTYSYFLPPSKMKVQWIDLKVDSTTSVPSYPERTVNTYVPRTLSTTTFNPNTCDYTTLLAVGFPKKTAGTFIKFREKGFVVKQKKDLLKVYGVSLQLYASLENLMVIDVPKKLEPAKEKTKKPVLPSIELNTADTTALQSLPGIGSVISKRIIKYRDLLGGFNSTDQLKEVFGINEELYELLSTRLTADSTKVKQLYPNLADFKVLSKHPYIGYELSKKLCDKRKTEALNFATVEALIGNTAQFQRLRPYLAFAR